MHYIALYLLHNFFAFISKYVTLLVIYKFLKLFSHQCVYYFVDIICLV